MGYQESPSLVVPGLPHPENGSGRPGSCRKVAKPKRRFKTMRNSLKQSVIVNRVPGMTYRILRAVFPPYMHQLLQYLCVLIGTVSAPETSLPYKSPSPSSSASKRCFRLDRIAMPSQWLQEVPLYHRGTPFSKDGSQISKVSRGTRYSLSSPIKWAPSRVNRSAGAIMHR